MALKEERIKRLVKVLSLLKKNKTRAFLKNLDDDQLKAIGEIINNVFQKKIPGINLKRLEKYHKTLREVNKNKKSSKALKQICGNHCIILEKVLLYLRPFLVRASGKKIKKRQAQEPAQEPAGENI